MARGKTDATDKTSYCADEPLASDMPDRAEIEAALDSAVADTIALLEGKQVVPGWHLISTSQVESIEIGSAKFPFLSRGRAESLVALSETNPHAFDLASYIAGMNVIGLLVTGVDLCPPISMFGARVLNGEVKRPPQLARPRAATTLLRLWQYGLCRFVAAETPLHLTRNDEFGRGRVVEIFTACDAVAEAFDRAGKHTTYAGMKSLCYDEAHRDIRELADYLHMTAISPN